jgi:hypothetical protein
MGPALLVLIVACANGAAILAARSARQTRDLAVRVSLGASPARLVRQVLAEAAVVGGVATLMAGPLTWAAVAGVRHELGAIAPGFDRSVAVDGRVVLAACATAFLATLLTGLLPAVRAGRANAGPLISRAPRRFVIRRGHYSTTDLLVVLQMGLAVVLVVVTALFAGVFDAIATHPPGGQPDAVVVAALTAANEVPIDASLLPAVVDALAASPGARGVALSDSLPLPGRRGTTIRTGDGREASCVGTVRTVTPEYFAVLGLPVRAGRIFDPGMPDGAVASASLAAGCWGQATSVGQHLIVGAPGSERRLDVVGVVDDGGRPSGITTRTAGDLYVPYSPDNTASAYVLIAAPGSVAVVNRGAGDVVRQASGGRLRLATPVTLRVLNEQQVREARVLTGLLGRVGAIAWLLATVGLYSSIAQALTARWRDFGVRAALGARPWSLAALTVGRHLPLVAIGATAGIVATVGITSVVWPDAVRIGGATPRAWATVVATLAFSAIAASAGPAIRASRLNPVSACDGTMSRTKAALTPALAGTVVARSVGR